MLLEQLKFIPTFGHLHLLLLLQGVLSLWIFAERTTAHHLDLHTNALLWEDSLTTLPRRALPTSSLLLVALTLHQEVCLGSNYIVE